MCMIDDCDTPTVYRESWQKAKKAYRCEECRRAIEAGEAYRRTFMVQDGNPGTYFTCRHCQSACVWLSRNCNGYLFSAVLEDIDEHVLEAHGACRIGLMRLGLGMRRQWRRFDGAGLLPVQAIPPTFEEAGFAPEHA